MQIIINQSQIHEAIRNYILAQISVVGEKEIQIELKATRGDEGYTAIINIGDPTPTPTTKTRAPAAQAAKSTTTRAPAASKSEPKAEAKAEAEATVAPAVDAAGEPPFDIDDTPASENVPVEPQAEPEVKATKPIFKPATKPAKEPANDAPEAAQGVTGEAPAAKPEKVLSFGRKPEEAAPEVASAANDQAPPRSIFASMQRPVNSDAK